MALQAHHGELQCVTMGRECMKCCKLGPTSYKVGDIPCQKFLRKCFVLNFPCTEEALEGFLAWFRCAGSLGLWHDEWSGQGDAHEQKVGEGLIKHQTSLTS